MVGGREQQLQADGSDFSGNLHLLTGPSDVGGQCPSPSYKYTYEGVDYCCCGDGCCWDKCTYTTPPIDCLENVPNSQWIYSQELGYYRGFVTIKGN